MAPVAAKAPAPACSHDSPSLYDSLSPHPHQVTADIERTLLPLPSSFLDERRWERSPLSITTRASTTNPIPSLSSHDKETVYQRTIFTHPRRQPDQTACRINRRDERRDTIRSDRGGIVLKRQLRAMRALIVSGIVAALALDATRIAGVTAAMMAMTFTSEYGFLECICFFLSKK